MNLPRIDTSIPLVPLPGSNQPGSASGVGLTTSLSVAPRPSDAAIPSLAARAFNAAVSAQFDRSFRAGLDATRAIDALDEIEQQLDELAALVGNTALRGGGDEGVRSRIDSLVESVNTAADRALSSRTLGEATLTYARGSPQVPSGGLYLSNVSERVQQARAFASLPPGGSLNVDVQVIASAHRGGLYLSFGGASLDLASPAARFDIEVAGNEGFRELSFASGTQIRDIVNAINSFTEITGVVARLSGSAGRPGSGIDLRAVDFGDHRFVSVNVLDSGGINQAVQRAGVYGYFAGNDNQVVPYGNDFRFHNSIYRDFGRDAGLLVNGMSASADGLRVRGVVDGALVQFRLTPDGGQRTGTFRAFTLVQPPADASPGATRAESPIRVALGDEPSIEGFRSFVRARRADWQRSLEAARAEAVGGVQASSTPLDAERVRALLSQP